MKLSNYVCARKGVTMRADYDISVNLKLVYEIDTLEELKTDRQLAEDICRMIADEATVAGGVASYDIIKSSVNVK